MTLRLLKNTVLLWFSTFILYGQQTNHKTVNNSVGLDQEDSIIVGANKTDSYLPLLQNKRVAIVANQTSVIFTSIENSYTHLVDSLLKKDINIRKVFAPEHGFRGQADAGEVFKDGVDTKTGIPIISLYGKNKKPSNESLSGIDIVVFDIQDVGARFYTYISSLHYVMEACAENNIPLLVLDRPNPNGHYIDGPILEPEHSSFVGMHPVPIVHGMTIGEYAQMINGEAWLANGIKAKLNVVPMDNYTHNKPYGLPIKPSPNLPNDSAINLYPSLCLFEGTTISVGRGTEMQFQIAGSPKLNDFYTFSFKPQPNEGAKYPKHQDNLCYGIDLRHHKQLDTLNLQWLINFYTTTKSKDPDSDFFNDFFTKLAGTRHLQKQIENGASIESIRNTWKKGLQDYNKMRKKYVLYTD